MEGCSIRAAKKRDFLRVSEYVMLQKALCGGNDQITMTAPLPVCSAKLSIVEPGQYYGGGPRWNPGCCSFLLCCSVHTHESFHCFSHLLQTPITHLLLHCFVFLYLLLQSLLLTLHTITRKAHFEPLPSHKVSIIDRNSIQTTNSHDRKQEPYNQPPHRH